MKNDDGTYTCYDRDMNVLLTTKYDIQPIENGYCSFADNEKGKIGFLFADGKTAIEPKYDCVTEMTPDGYFVSKTISHSEITYDTTEINYTVTIEDKGGNAVIEKTQNVCDIANSAFDSKSLYGYFDGYRYYADKFAEYENVEFSNIQILPQNDYGKVPTDFYGNELFEEYEYIGFDFMPVSVNGNTLCVTAEYYNDEGYSQCILLNLNGERLYRNGRRLKLIHNKYIIGISDNKEPADLYNTDGSVMLTLKDIKDPDSIEAISIVGNSVLVKSYTGSAIVYDKTTGEIIYKPDTDGSNVDFIYENLIKTGVYNEAAGGWSYIFIDLDTKKSFELPGDRVVFRNSGNNSEGHITENAEYPLMCCTFSYLPNQINYLYPALWELNVYQIDENMEVKLVRTYSSDDGILYMVDDYNSGSGLYAYIDRIDDTAVRNIRLVNAWNGNEKYFENVSEFSVQDNEVWIGIYDESVKRTAYKLSTDLETMEQAE